MKTTSSTVSAGTQYQHQLERILPSPAAAEHFARGIVADSCGDSEDFLEPGSFVPLSEGSTAVR
jgi:hypothetical protein